VYDISNEVDVSYTYYCYWHWLPTTDTAQKTEGNLTATQIPWWTGACQSFFTRSALSS